MSLEFRAATTLGSFAYAADFCASQEILVLFGHSGAGKSITLQMIAGLLPPFAGRIVIDGRAVFDAGASVNLPPQERGVGYVVQDLALFQNMTVRQNIEFGVPRGRTSRADELIGLLGLAGFESRRPRSLSGGQQQRVALARALAREATLLLLDEPFSALDESLRSALRRELLRLRRDLGLTIVFVTHDLREAHLLADQLAVFDEGRMLQVGPREEVFRRPRSRRVAELTGVANILEATVLSHELGQVVVMAGNLRLQTSAPAADFPVAARVDVAIRAERVILRREPLTPSANMFEAEVVEEFAYGATHTLRCHPIGAGPALEVEIASRPYEVLGLAGRKRWLIELPPSDLHVMAVEGGSSP